MSAVRELKLLVHTSLYLIHLTAVNTVLARNLLLLYRYRTEADWGSSHASVRIRRTSPCWIDAATAAALPGRISDLGRLKIDVRFT